MNGNYMTESEYNELADVVFMRIEKAIDASGADIDCNLNGPVMELEFLDGSKLLLTATLQTRKSGLQQKPVATILNMLKVSGLAVVTVESCLIS